MNNESSSSNKTSLVPEPYVSLVIRLFLYGVVVVLTVIGNLMVIIVIMKNRKLRSIETYYYGYYLMNLAIADLSVGVLIIPLTLIYTETRSWPYGVFLCKFIPTLLITLIAASVLTLLILTFERYWAIVYPFKPRLAKNRLMVILALVWVFSFAAGSPELFVYQLKPTNISGAQIQEKYPCREIWPTQNQRQAYTTFIFIYSYLLPLVLILAAYLRIVFELRRNTTKCYGAKEKDHVRKTVKVLIIVVASFALCYLPDKVLFFWIDYGDGGSYPYIDILMKYAYLINWCNSCINPIIYGAVDINFRNFYAALLRQCAGCKKYGSEIKRHLSSGRPGSMRQGEFDLTTGMFHEEV